MATAANIITRMRTISEHDLTELFSDADALELVNECYAEVWGKTDWPFSVTETTLTVTAGNSAVNLPSDFRYPIAVRDSRETEWRKIPYANAFTSYITDNEYKITSTQFKVRGPVGEDTVFTFVYGTAPDVLLSSDSPAFPAEFHYLLAYMGAAKLLRREGDDSGRSEQYDVEAKIMVDNMGRSMFGPVTRPFVVGEATARSVRLRR